MLASIEVSAAWLEVVIGRCETPADLLLSILVLPSLDSSVADVVRVGVGDY